MRIVTLENWPEEWRVWKKENNGLSVGHFGSGGGKRPRKNGFAVRHFRGYPMK